MKIFIYLFLITFLITLITADFAVISDIHYDMYYSEGSPTKCYLGDTGMGCCRTWSIPLNNSTPAPKYGISGCDSPLALINIIINWLQSLKVEYLVSLGDIVDHDLILQSPSYNFQEISDIAQALKTLPYPTFSILGNHDGFIIGNLWDNSFGQEWLDEVQNQYGFPTNLTRGGYYSVEFENYTALFLNCLAYDMFNIEVEVYPEKDLFNQTAWLVDQIEINKKKNRQIFLFNHFGSDTDEATKFFNIMIENLKYENITYFAGHTHEDDIRMMKSSFFYLHPSIVPDEHFPEIRVYREENGEIIDYIQYGFNLTSLKFEEIYSARYSYSLKNLSFPSWTDFFERMKTNDTLRYLYNKHKYWGNNKIEN